jgi:2-(1,2-epoxy-1,2-dihydrophenyl)acetyl-CoA isomerase
MEHIRVERYGAVGFITIDRRERFNSLDVETAQAFRKAGLGFARDAEIRAVVIQGSGGVFCSGVDLKYILAGGEQAELGYLSPPARQVPPGYGEVFKQILEYIHSTISEIKRAPKPFIAAVDGVAAAGGFGIAMACDLVLASERATFEWAYQKTGLTGAESSTFFLPRLIGLRRSMELVLLNPRLDARAALELGLITRVYSTERFPEEVLAIARELAKGPTRAYGIAKSLLNQAAGVDRLDYHLDHELESLARIADGRDFAEGLEAFLSRRLPRFED